VSSSVASVLDAVFLFGLGGWAYLVAKGKRRDEVGWAIVAALAFYVPGYLMENALFPTLAARLGWAASWAKPSAFIAGGLCGALVDLYLTLLVKPLLPPEGAEGGEKAVEGARTRTTDEDEGRLGEARVGEGAIGPEAAGRDYAALARQFWPVLVALGAFALTYLPLLWVGGVSEGTTPGGDEEMAAGTPDPLESVRYFVLPLVTGTLAWRLRGRMLEGIAAALLTLMFAPTIQWMVWRWGRGSSYYSHGYLIPFVVAWLVWMNRGRLGRLEARGDFRLVGLGTLVGGLLLLLGGAFIRAFFVQGIALVMVLCGAVFFVYGRAISRVVLFPLLFTLTMVPMPMHVVERVTFKLKMIATAASVSLVDFLRAAGLHGRVVVQDGSYIRWETAGGGMDHIIIGDVCSGLRSLIALLAFGALFAYIARLSLSRKLVLFAAAVPISILANMWRIVTLTFLGTQWGSHAVHGWVHDVTGYGIFAIAFVLFFVFERVLRKFEPGGEGLGPMGAEAAG